MYVLAFGLQRFIHFSLLLLSLFYQHLNFVFNHFSIVQEILVFLLPDFVFNGNEIWFFNCHSGVEEFHFFGFEVFLGSEEDFLFLFDLGFPVLFFVLFFLEVSILLLSDVVQEFIFGDDDFLLFPVEGFVKFDIFFRRDEGGEFLVEVLAGFVEYFDFEEEFLFSIEVFVEESGEVFDLSLVALVEGLSAFLLLLYFLFISFDEFALPFFVIVCSVGGSSFRLDLSAEVSLFVGGRFDGLF